MGRAYVGDRLVADQFYSGGVWDIGLDRLPADALRTEGLRLRVLPLPPGRRCICRSGRGRRETRPEIAQARVRSPRPHTWSSAPAG